MWKIKIKIQWWTSFFICRTRLGVDAKRPGGERQFSGMMDVYVKTIKADGLLGLYRGFGISCSCIFIYRCPPSADLVIKTKRVGYQSQSWALLAERIMMLASYWSIFFISLLLVREWVKVKVAEPWKILRDKSWGKCSASDKVKHDWQCIGRWNIFLLITGGANALAPLQWMKVIRFSEIKTKQCFAFQRKNQAVEK